MDKTSFCTIVVASQSSSFPDKHALDVAYNLNLESLNWNPISNLNEDGLIGIDDLMVVGARFGDQWVVV